MAFDKGKGGGGGGDTVSTEVITQTAHGFTVPQVVYLDDSDSLYKLAKADVVATANALGVVTKVNSVNSFTLSFAGVHDVFTGLTEGETYYVSSTVAGGISNAEPTISRPVLNALSATQAYVFTDAIKDISGGSLPYVVGKAGGTISYEYNTIQSAIDAVEAATNDDNVIVVTPGIYTEDLTIAAVNLHLTTLGAAPNAIQIIGDVSITASTSTSNISIDGLTVIGATTTSGTAKLLLSLNHTEHTTTGSQVFSWGNTNTDSTMDALHCFFLEGGSATAALERTAGTPAINLIDCIIDGHVDLSDVNGGRLEASNLVLFDGEIDLSNTTLISQFTNPTVRTIGSGPAFDLTNTGSCLVVGGLMDVPGGGNAITPATGANFTFANVATTSGTVLTTAMGTRLATDGVTLTSNGSATTFLNGTGAYSTPANIYNSDGIITATRTVTAPSNRMISFNTFDVNDFNDSQEEGFIQATHDRVAIGYLDLDGAGGIDGASQIILTPSSMLVVDSVNNKGLIYGADYSSNFTALSLIDKAYSDQGILSRSASGASDLTSASKPILAVTNTAAPRTVTIATSDIQDEGRTFIVKDESGGAGTNNITVTTPTISVTSVAAGTSGSDFITSTVHGYVTGQVVLHAGFSDSSYNGLFTVSAIVNTTRYEVAAITFVATDTGTSNIAIDGQASFVIAVDYGSIELYSNGLQVFTKGASNLAFETSNAVTGLLEGGVVSLVTPSSPFGTTLDITALKGVVVDVTDPVLPVVTAVEKDAVSGYQITTPTLNEDGVYIIGCDDDGTIVEILLAELTNTDRQDYILFGIFAIDSGVAFTATPLPLNLGYDGATTSQDFIRDVIGPANIEGNAISNNNPSTNLRMDNAGGRIFLLGSNFRSSTQTPNDRTIPADTEISFFRVFRESGTEQLETDTPAGTQDPNPGDYDTGTGSLVSADSGKWYIQVLYITRLGQYVLAYAQQEYDSENDVNAALVNGSPFEEYPTLQVMVPVAFLVLKGSATNFSDPSEAKIVLAPKFRMTNGMLKV